MKKPSLEEVREYMAERGENVTDQHEAFYDYHESRGWKVGKVAMKDWKAAVRTWIRNMKTWNTRYAKDKSNYQTHSDRQRQQAADALREIEALERGDGKNGFGVIC